MPSTVLLVDSGSGIRDLVERHIDPGSWTIVERDDVDAAWAEAVARAPDLVVLNADVAKGWNLCAQFKRRFASVPVVLLSYKANKELFNNHQKLPTRADAYHHLPDELEGLGISLQYFCSHKSEAQLEDESPRLRPRTGTRVAVPTGVVARLESTVRDQARELEGLKRQIEALEAERDAVSEKARRQMLELMAVSPGPDVAAELAQEKKRRAELTAELEAFHAATREASDRARASEDARRSAETTATNALSELVAMRATVHAAGNSVEQVAALTVQLQQEQERRAAAEQQKIAAEERATTAERAWSGVNTRAEELHQALAARSADVERAVKEKGEVEAALAMSRKLMKDYISEAARSAEASRTASERARVAEAATAEAEKARTAAQGELEFQRALVESLEDAAKKAAAQVKALEVHAVELDARLVGTEAARVEAAQRADAASARVRALELDLQAAEAALNDASAAQTQASEATAATKLAHEQELLAQQARLEGELAAARAQHAHELAAAQAELAAAQVAHAQALGALRAQLEGELAAATQRLEGELAATTQRLEGEVATTRSTLEAELRAVRAEREAHEAASRERFEAVRGWARRQERELGNAEAMREAVMTRLQSLVDDLHHVPLTREPAPPVIDGA